MNELPDEEREIFLQALEYASSEEREDHLREACGDDEALLQRIRALLNAHENAAASLPTEPAAGILTAATEPVAEIGSSIGPYKLLQQVGEGGMGLVYMAEQSEPIVRRVALKIIKLGMDTRAVIARFEAERQALAVMDHPNIAKVLDAGATANGRPYFVMELVHGVPIDEFCDRNHLSPKERLELFLPVCSAIQHAHLKGIIHRDLKPSNIMVTLHDGKPVPKVIDFGIAKATNQRLTEKTLFTQYGQMVGTPNYMSPEQAEMSGLDVDTRSDVYSLGVVLYKLLTGATPISAKELRNQSFGEMQRMIVEKEPPKPSTRLSTLGERPRTVVAKNRSIDAESLNRLLRGDLDWIVMKALEKDRTRRYESASGLAADIRRHLNDEPVEAGAPGPVLRLRKLFRRHRAAVSSLTAVFGALLIGVVVSSRLYLRAEDERQAAAAARAVAEENADEALRAGEQLKLQLQETRAARQAEAEARETTRGLLYASDMKLFKEAWDAGNPRQAIMALERQQPVAGDADLRGFEWRHFWQISHAQKASLRHETKTGRQGDDFVHTAVSSDGRHLVTASSESAGLWELPTGRRLQEWPTPVGALIHCVQFDPSGEQIQLVTQTPAKQKTMQAGMKQMMRLLQDDADSSIKELLDRLEFRRRPVNAGGNWTRAKFDPRQMGDKMMQFFVHTGRARSGLLVHPVSHQGRIVNPSCLAVSPDRSLLLLGGLSQTLPRLDAKNGTADFGKMLREQQGAILIWDIKKEHVVKLLEHHSAFVMSLAMSPDQRQVLSSSLDGDVLLHDLQTGRTRPLPDHRHGMAIWTQFSPEGSRFAVGHSGGVVAIRSVADLSLISSLQTRTTRYPEFAWQPDAGNEAGGVLVAAADDGIVEIWSDTTEQGPREIPLETTLLIDATTMDSSRHHATVDNHGTYRVCDLTTGSWREPRSILQHIPKTGTFARSMAMSPSGTIAGAEPDGLINVFPAQSDAIPIVFSAFQDQSRRLALSSDGNRLAAADPKTGEVHIWQVDSESKLGMLPVKDRQVRNLVFSPDGRLLAHAGSRGVVRIFDLETLEETHVWPRFDAGGRLMTFSPDNTHLLSAGSLEVKLWDVPSGETRFQTRATMAVLGAALHPDGSRIAIAQWSEGFPAKLDLFDTRTGREIVTLGRSRDARFEHLAFTPDGARLTAWLSPIARSDPFKQQTHLLKVWDTDAAP